MNSNIAVAVVGGGPAGLMAAEAAAARGVRVELFDAMPSSGRKFLMAGKGGLNLTHSEPFAAFVRRYGTRWAILEPLLSRFGPDALRAWAEGLGVATFIGSSGRVFPRDFKAAPLLRAWLHRLRAAGVSLHMRHRWMGFEDDGALRFDTPDGPKQFKTGAVVLAMGGGSWSRLGSDGAWVPALQVRGVEVAPLKPANCGFDIGWSAFFAQRFAGHPLKPVVAVVTDPDGTILRQQGEIMVTETGVEGGLVYAMSAALRDRIERDSAAVLTLDLAPGRTLERLAGELARPRGKRSLSSHLKRHAGIEGVKAALLREGTPREVFDDPAKLAALIKAFPLRLVAARPLEEAISSAGGVRFEALDERLMLKALPGVFCAGEMLDWEAPTGGYLLTACFATGSVAGEGAADWVARL